MRHTSRRNATHFDFTSKRKREGGGKENREREEREMERGGKKKGERERDKERERETMCGLKPELKLIAMLIPQLIKGKPVPMIGYSYETEQQ